MRDEGESKDPESVCSSILIQGVLPRDCPRNRSTLNFVVEAVAGRAQHAQSGEKHLVSAWQRTHSRDSFGFAQDRLFDAPSVSRYAGSFALAQDDRVGVFGEPN